MSNSKKLQPKKWWGQKCKKRKHKTKMVLFLPCGFIVQNLIPISLLIQYSFISVLSQQLLVEFQSIHWDVKLIFTKATAADVVQLMFPTSVGVTEFGWVAITGVFEVGLPIEARGDHDTKFPRKEREREKIVKINGSQSFSQGSLKTVLQQSLVKWSSS